MFLVICDVYRATIKLLINNGLYSHDIFAQSGFSTRCILIVAFGSQIQTKRSKNHVCLAC